MSEKFNTFNINSILLHPQTSSQRLIPESFLHSSLLYCVVFSILRITNQILSSIINIPFKYKVASCNSYRELYDKTILFLLPTLNNYKALEGVIENVGKELSNVKVIKEYMRYDSYPLVRIHFKSLMELPHFWKQFYTYSHDERRIINYYMAHYIYAPGFVWFYNKVLQRYRPKCVIFSNDHSFITRSLILACEDYNIPTIYVQHASVSYAFPELHFTYSFLDGWDSLNKYIADNKNTKGTIFLLGAARYDHLSLYCKNRKQFPRETIGIAVNALDDINKINKLCSEILSSFPEKKIKIRTHPSLKSNPLKIIVNENIIYTCASDESTTDYLDSIDLQIANDSGVHFDSILGGVKTIAFNMSQNEYGDNYHYVSTGMISIAKDFQDIKKFISDDNYYCLNPTIIRFFDEAFGKTYAGKCSLIISDFISHQYDVDYICSKYGFERKKIHEKYYYIIPQ